MSIKGKQSDIATTIIERLEGLGKYPSEEEIITQIHNYRMENNIKLYFNEYLRPEDLDVFQKPQRIIELLENNPNLKPFQLTLKIKDIINVEEGVDDAKFNDQWSKVNTKTKEEMNDRDFLSETITEVGMSEFVMRSKIKENIRVLDDGWSFLDYPDTNMAEVEIKNLPPFLTQVKGQETEDVKELLELIRKYLELHDTKEAATNYNHKRVTNSQ